eukprot:1477514-Rhodomonas_salina.1
MFSSKTVLCARRLQIPRCTLAPSRGLAATSPVASAWRLGLPSQGPPAAVPAYEGTVGRAPCYGWLQGQLQRIALAWS